MAQGVLGHKNVFQRWKEHKIKIKKKKTETVIGSIESLFPPKMSRNPHSFPGNVSLCGNSLHGYKRGIRKPHWVRVYTDLTCLLSL